MSKELTATYPVRALQSPGNSVWSDSTLAHATPLQRTRLAMLA